MSGYRNVPSQCNCLRFIARPVCALILTLFWAASGYASELKILDSAGLVRAIKVVRSPIVVVVTIKSDIGTGVLSDSDSSQECRAVNISGLAADRSVILNATRRCVFRNMPAGIWQIKIPQGKEWKVHFDDE